MRLRASQIWQQQFMASKRDQLLQHQQILLENQHFLHSLIGQTLSAIQQAQSAPHRVRQLKLQQARLREQTKQLFEQLRIARLNNVKMQDESQRRVKACCDQVKGCLAELSNEQVEAMAYDDYLLDLLQKVDRNSQPLVNASEIESAMQREDMKVKGELDKQSGLGEKPKSKTKRIDQQTLTQNSSPKTQSFPPKCFDQKQLEHPECQLPHQISLMMMNICAQEGLCSEGCGQLVKQQRRQLEMIVLRMQEVDSVLTQEKAKRQSAQQALDQQMEATAAMKQAVEQIGCDSHEMKLIVVRLQHENKVLREQLEEASWQLHRNHQQHTQGRIAQKRTFQAIVLELRIQKEQLDNALEKKNAQAIDLSCKLQREKVQKQEVQKELARVSGRLKESESSCSQLQGFLDHELARQNLSGRLANEQQLREQNDRLRGQLNQLQESQHDSLAELQHKLLQVKGLWQKQQLKYQQLLQRIDQIKEHTRRQKNSLNELVEELEGRIEELTLSIRTQKQHFIEKLDQQYSEKEQLLQTLYRTEEALKEVLAENTISKNRRKYDWTSRTLTQD